MSELNGLLSEAKNNTDQMMKKCEEEMKLCGLIQKVLEEMQKGIKRDYKLKESFI